jgi:pseudaminic acid biosynthesis-associated methylase
MLKKFTKQMKFWGGNFGRKYTDRNTFSLKELDSLYRCNSGVPRSKMNAMFLGKLDRDMRILEVGCNVGNQLRMLQKMGFKNLYGIELNQYAVEQAKKNSNNINIIYGSAFDIPFKDGFFDLVFTAGVLIHIHPRNIKNVLKEIYRCSSKYIWGYEFYAPDYTMKVYRGHEQLFWKTDFPKLYANLFPKLRLIKVKHFKYLKNNDIDVMFLYKKQG